MQSPIPITLAVEDDLSETMAVNLLAQSGLNYSIGSCYKRGGKNYLRRLANGLNNSAKGCPCFLLTDLDNDSCPASLIDSWLSGNRHRNMLFRVAVTEIESWVMADRENFSDFLGISVEKIPKELDRIMNAKEFLISLARMSRKRSVLEDIVPKQRSTARVGPNYNGKLSDFLNGNWTASNAVLHSESLKRSFERLKDVQWP